jgi:hypothetical protein
MSGYFQDLVVDYKANQDKISQINNREKKHSKDLMLEGISKMKKSSEDNLDDHRNKLAEKNLNSEKEKYLTEIKNPNILENLERNPFNQLKKNSYPSQQKYFNPIMNLESKSQIFTKPILRSNKKTPDKDRLEKLNNFPKIDFSFKKKDQEKIITQNQQNQFFNGQLQSPVCIAKESPFYNVSPGGISMMMQRAQNKNLEEFMSPNIATSTFSQIRKNNGGSLFKVNLQTENLNGN